MEESEKKWVYLAVGVATTALVGYLYFMKPLKTVQAAIGQERRYGMPRTEEERQLRHGPGELPPRGTGLNLARNPATTIASKK